MNLENHKSFLSYQKVQVFSLVIVFFAEFAQFQYGQTKYQDLDLCFHPRSSGFCLFSTYVFYMYILHPESI